MGYNIVCPVCRTNKVAVIDDKVVNHANPFMGQASVCDASGKIPPLPIQFAGRHPALIVLDILLRGHPVVDESGEQWYYQGGKYGVKREMVDSKSENRRDVILSCDTTLPGFVRWCENLSEGEIRRIVFNAVLHDK